MKAMVGCDEREQWLMNEDLRNHMGCRLESNDTGAERKGEKREITNLNTLQNTDHIA
jgi:hypothetical protein